MKTQRILATLILGALCQFTPALSRAQATNSARPNTTQLIEQRIRSAVGARLMERGAAFNSLQVAPASEETSGTPFKVTYTGLSNFRGTDGTTPPADGEFIMNAIGGARWSGSLAGVEFTVTVGRVDNIDLPFVNDPQLLGQWESVDFVPDIAKFNPSQPTWKGKLYLKELTFLADGKTPQGWWTWTKGFVLHHGDQTASHYEIRTINGRKYLFFEWRSGDVMIADRKPHYYVLTPKAPKSNP